jgi:excisionase family DNA binding protein
MESFPVKPFLSVDDLSGMLDLPRSFVYEHCRKGTKDPIPGAYMFGKHLRFKREDVERWIEKHRKNGH